MTITSSSSASRCASSRKRAATWSAVPTIALRAQPLDDALLRRRIRLRGRFVGRQQRSAQPLLESHAPMLARVQLPPRFLFAVGGERPDADRRLRLGMIGARPIVRAVQMQRFLDAAAVAEEIREGVRQVRSAPRAARRSRSCRGSTPRACVVPVGFARIARNGWSSGSGVSPSQHSRSRTCRGNSSAAFEYGLSASAVSRSEPGARPTPEVDAPRRDGLEHAKLLGHLERRVVRKHHARAADADAARRRRDGRHQYLGRGADDAVAVVMLGHPVAVIAERVAVPRVRKRLADRVVLSAALRAAVD